jgi:hypothetical protein
MALKDLFGTSKELETQGAWCVVDKTEDGEMKFLLAYAGSSNKQFLKESARLARGKRVSVNNVEMTQELTKEVFVNSIILGWENVVVKKGEKPLPYNKENAKMLLDEFPALFDLLSLFATDISNYQIDDREEIAKN